MELPADIAVLLDRLRVGLLARGDLVGLYLYGSLTTGDFSPARSDIDVMVMVRRDPDQAAISDLRQLHTTLAGSGGGAAGRLHCLYIPVGTAADPAALRTYWYGDRMTQWQLKVMTQAELMAAGLALFGPWPPPGLRPVPTPAIQAAVHEEITGYWRRMARRRRCWWQDSWVVFGLTVLPRAEAILTAGDLITKSEAISRLTDVGVPAPLARQVRRYRDGEAVPLSVVQRFRRARLVRQVMRRELQRLSRLEPRGSAVEDRKNR